MTIKYDFDEKKYEEFKQDRIKMHHGKTRGNAFIRWTCRIIDKFETRQDLDAVERYNFLNRMMSDKYKD